MWYVDTSKHIDHDCISSPHMRRGCYGCVHCIPGTLDLLPSYKLPVTIIQDMMSFTCKAVKLASKS